MIWLAHLIILFSRLFDLLGAGPVREIIRGVGLDLKILAHDKIGGFALGLFSLAGHVEAAFMYKHVAASWINADVPALERDIMSVTIRD